MSGTVFKKIKSDKLFLKNNVDQIVFNSSGNTATLSVTAPASAVTYTIPNVGTSSFTMTQGDQTLDGNKTFNNQVSILAVSNQLKFGTTNTTTLNVAATSASQIYTIPDTKTNASFVMTELDQDIKGVKSFTDGIKSNSIESIGTTLNLGSTNTTEIVNIANGTGIQQVNIGTIGSGITTINIGGVGDIVNIAGSANNVQTTNLNVTNKFIQLNNNAVGSGTARSSGFYIRDNNVDTNGYILTSLTGNFFRFKAPENGFVLSTPILSADGTFITDVDAQTISGVKTFNNSSLRLGTSINNVTFSAANVTGAINLTFPTISTNAVLMTDVGDQTITGIKTFNNSSLRLGTGINNVTFSAASVTGAINLTFPTISSNAVLVTDVGDQTITGIKTFSNLRIGGVTNNATFSAASVTGNITVSLPTLSGNTELVTTSGTQNNITGNKTFTGVITLGSLTANQFLSLNANSEIVSSGLTSTNIARTNVNNLFSTTQTMPNLTLNGLVATNTSPTFIFGTSAADANLNTSKPFEMITASQGNTASSVAVRNSSGNLFANGLFATATSNQIVVGTTNTVTINAVAPAASRTYNIQDAGGSADFVMTLGNQSISGVKTFLSSPVIDVSGGAVMTWRGTGQNGYQWYSISDTDGFNVWSITANTSIFRLKNTLTANRILTTDGSNYVASATFGPTDLVLTSTDQTIAGIKTFSSSPTITTTTNQLVLGTTNTVTINAVAPAASRVYTIRDVGGIADFVMTAGSQSLSGVKTFSSGIPITATTNQLVLGTTNTVTINAVAPAASRTYSIQDTGGPADFVMTAGTQTISGNKTFSGTATFNNIITTGNFMFATAFVGTQNTPSGSTITVLFNTSANSGIINIVSTFQVAITGIYHVCWTLRVTTAAINEQSSWAESSDNTSIKYGLQPWAPGTFYCSSSALVPVNAGSTIRIRAVNGRSDLASFSITNTDSILYIKYVGSN